MWQELRTAAHRDGQFPGVHPGGQVPPRLGFHSDRVGEGPDGYRVQKGPKGKPCVKIIKIHIIKKPPASKKK